MQKNDSWIKARLVSIGFIQYDAVLQFYKMDSNKLSRRGIFSADFVLFVKFCAEINKQIFKIWLSNAKLSYRNIIRMHMAFLVFLVQHINIFTRYQVRRFPSGVSLFALRGFLLEIMKIHKMH